MNAIRVWSGDLMEGGHEKLWSWKRLMVDEICHPRMEGS